jgi:hypothetical protein
LGTGIGADTNQFQIFDGNAGENRLTIASTGAATFSSSVNVGGTSANTDFRVYRTVSSGTFFSISAPGGSPSTSTLGVNGTDVMTLNASGNVGIGTASPSGALQVAGDIYLGTYHSTNKLAIGADLNQYLRYNTGLDGVELSGYSGVMFSTVGGTERMRITSDGYARLSATSGGIQFNGDTAAANALDDYEEGTWTMGISFGGASSGVTYSDNTGTYTKIGRKVTVNGWLNLALKGSSVGAARITGLPFTTTASYSNYSAISFRATSISYVGLITGFPEVSSTTILLEEMGESGTNTVLRDTDFSNGSSIMISLTYFI